MEILSFISIQTFFQEKLQEQERVIGNHQMDLGKLYCRAYYHQKEETLYVESKMNDQSLSIRHEFFSYFMQKSHTL